MADRYARYERLSPDEQGILRVLSVICEPVNQTALQQVLDKLAWRDGNGAPLSRLLGKALRERLLVAGLIEQARSDLACHSELLEPLTRATVADGTFGEIVAAAEGLVPTQSVPSWQVPSEERQLRRLRNILYAGQEQEVLAMLRLDGPVSLSQLRHVEVKRLARICTRSPDPEWLLGLGPRLRVAALAPMLREAALDLTADPSTYRLMEQVLAPAADASPEAAYALAEQRLLRGRLAEVPPLLAGRTDPDALTLQGWLQFLQGDYAGTIASIQAAELAVRKQTRKRNFYTPGIPGALYLLALLRRGERADFDLVQRQVAVCLRASVTDLIEHGFRVLADLATVLAGQRRPAECPWLGAGPAPREAVSALLRLLALRWLGQPPTPEAVKALAASAHQAAKAGLDWYAQEASALLGAFGFGGESPSLGGPLPGLVLLTDLLVPKAPWEIALEALKGFGAQATADHAQADEDVSEDRRMAWLLELRQGYATLEPREQRRLKRGGWTLGRAVAIQRLVEEPDGFPYLTPQDRAICACILREQEMTWYGGQPRVLYRLDIDRAPLAAVGHPCVLRRAIDAPIELTRGVPTLTAVRRSKDILVRIEPFPPEDHSVLPVEETPQRIRLVHFDARHREIARILGPKGLSVPPGGEERLLAGLAAVAPLLTVHSDIGGGAEVAETVIADRRPHLHLTASAEGLGLDLYVHPLGDAGPQLRPGQGGATLFSEIDRRAVRCTRDLRGERAAARAVLEQCPALDASEGWTWHLDDLEQALTALEQLHTLGDAVALDWPQGRRIGLTKETQVAQLRVSISQQADWLAVGGGLRLDDGRVLEMRDLLELATASKGRFVRLGEDDYLVLSNALRRRLDSLHGLTDGGRFHPLAAPAINEILDGVEVQADRSWRGLLERIAAAQTLEPQVPSTLQAELRDYQLDGYRWLARLAHWGAGACLADDMGLGKTVQALALILSRAPQGPTLVLAPMSVCGNWMDEAQRFAPTLRPQRFGPGDRAAALREAGPFDLIVCSYGLLQTEGKRLAEVGWETIVADEAQAFKNALTKRSQAMMRLRGSSLPAPASRDAGASLRGAFRIITTGTPIENHLGELWNLFRFINPGLLGSLETFNRRFAAPIEQAKDQGARQRLRHLLRPFILRRLKSDVLSELPPRTETTLRLELSAGETALYEALRRQAIERIEESPEGNAGQQRMQLLAEIMRLRRACCHPRLVLPDSDLPSTKLEAFGEIVEELIDNRHKALVFSQFVDHLRLVRAHLDARGIRYQYLDGSTPEPQRRAAVAAFQAGEGELFLISLRAGGAGLNLTAADYVIHMDPWWNPAVEDQASDRAHRIGQERPVTIYRLVAKDTIEERILKLHASKRDLADGLLAGADDGGRLSYADMLALVRDTGIGG